MNKQYVHALRHPFVNRHGWIFFFFQRFHNILELSRYSNESRTTTIYVCSNNNKKNDFTYINVNKFEGRTSFLQNSQTVRLAAYVYNIERKRLGSVSISCRPEIGNISAPSMGDVSSYHTLLYTDNVTGFNDFPRRDGENRFFAHNGKLCIFIAKKQSRVRPQCSPRKRYSCFYSFIFRANKANT